MFRVRLVGRPAYVSLPEPTQRQLEALVKGVQAALDADLRGILLHGSAAMGGFEPSRSDLDVLVVTRAPLVAAQRAMLGAVMLRSSCDPHPLELSVVIEQDLLAWRHPCPHQFHFGEAHRARFARGDMAPRSAGDPDLAAHVTVARARGVDLLGSYAPECLPEVPRYDFLDAVAQDFAWAAAGELDSYRFANACRTWAYLCAGQVLSKAEGIQWCQARRVGLANIVEVVEDCLRCELESGG